MALAPFRKRRELLLFFLVWLSTGGLLFWRLEAGSRGEPALFLVVAVVALVPAAAAGFFRGIVTGASAPSRQTPGNPAAASDGRGGDGAVREGG